MILLSASVGIVMISLSVSIHVVIISFSVCVGAIIILLSVSVGIVIQLRGLPLPIVWFALNAETPFVEGDFLDTLPWELLNNNPPLGFILSKQ
jgi:hypothetical protein